MNILDTIVAEKQIEVKARKLQVSVKELERSKHFALPIYSMSRSIRDASKSGIIMEFKRQSPSKGVINGTARVEQTTLGYQKAGASALSVLTDNKFFGGSSDDLVAARKVTQIPIIRKDFTIDEYQIVEARSFGADAILLIAAVLKPEQVRQFTDFAHGLGMEVLLEVHDEEELTQNLEAGADLIGVNNRNLKTFEVNIETSIKLASLIPDEVVKVSESGISDPATIVQLRSAGYSGFLMGENFMKHPFPEVAAMEFTTKLKATV